MTEQLENFTAVICKCDQWSENDIYSPPSENDIFPPFMTYHFSTLYRVLFALILPYFAFNLPFYFSFLSFFFPFLPFSFTFSLFFSSPFHIFPPK
jgi:hypothetical protein